jgi:ubiquitin carboxyl-terminal hydrolase 1
VTCLRSAKSLTNKEPTALNTSSSRRKALRPEQVIKVLSKTGQERGDLFASREHQDAQELFQLISETLKEEALAVDREVNRDRGLGAITPEEELPQSSVSQPTKSREPGKGVFEGLTANRRSCAVCDYTEAVMHFSFDNIQLTVPRAASCNLYNCLDEFTKMEVLNDCVCRKCSMLATLGKLQREVEKVERLAAENMGAADEEKAKESAGRNRRIREAKKFEARVSAALEDGRIEEDVKGVTLERVVSPRSTKHTMIARVSNNLSGLYSMGPGANAHCSRPQFWHYISIVRHSQATTQ